jgi:hypothetical protein
MIWLLKYRLVILALLLPRLLSEKEFIENISLKLRLSARSHQKPLENKTSTSSLIIHHITLNDSNAACLDGSKPQLYLRSGYGSGSSKWNVFFQGLLLSIERSGC